MSLQLLTHVINLSFISGIFPEKLKISKDVPLFKEGKRDQKRNYRPVSVISGFSKIY